MYLNYVLLALLLAATLWTVMARSLLRSAIALGVTSAMLALLMFRFGAPTAAAFELSVCAGLITAVFVSAVALTTHLSPAEQRAATRDRWKRYAALPVILVLAAIFLLFQGPLGSVAQGADGPLRTALWSLRQTDILGQVILLMAGVFGVVILFKERGQE